MWYAKGSSHPLVASQWLSRKISKSPVECLAPESQIQVAESYFYNYDIKLCLTFLPGKYEASLLLISVKVYVVAVEPVLDVLREENGDLFRAGTVVNQDDLMEKVRGRLVDDRPYGPHQGRHSLVAENENDGSFGEGGRITVVQLPTLGVPGVWQRTTNADLVTHIPKMSQQCMMLFWLSNCFVTKN